jgi:large repetitive protein
LLLVVALIQSGNFIVVVTGPNSCTTTKSQIVIVNLNPNVLITPNGQTTFCEGDSLKLTASGGINYVWSTGAMTPSVFAKQNQIFEVTVTAANGCTQTATVTTTMKLRPTATVLPNFKAICAGDSTQFTANGGETYLWRTPQGNPTTPSVWAKSGGIYTAVAIGANGCRDSINATLQVNPLPIADITVKNTGIPNVFCEGDTLTLIGKGGMGFNWANGLGNDSTIQVRQNGTYTVTVTSSFGCRATSSKAISFLTVPTIQITGVNTICEGTSQNLLASGSTGSYVWSTGATTSAISINRAGTYAATVTAVNGCRNSIKQVVTALPLPTARITYTYPIVGSAGRVNFNSSTSVGASTYNWRFSDGQTSILANPSINFTTNGSKSAQLIVVNSTQCVDSTTQTVLIGNVSANDLPEGVMVNLAPNPVTDILMITVKLPNGLPKSMANTIRIKNSLGQQIIQKTITDTPLSIDTFNWVSGLYFVEIIIDGKAYFIGKVSKI